MTATPECVNAEKQTGALLEDLGRELKKAYQRDVFHFQSYDRYQSKESVTFYMGCMPVECKVIFQLEKQGASLSNPLSWNEVTVKIYNQGEVADLEKIIRNVIERNLGHSSAVQFVKG
ncbi:MAG: hypothetical protein HY602_02925 [Parcubacteria group bacterium]|nr:hypothetical protein [Parcubacteria group bacterium]